MGKFLGTYMQTCIIKILGNNFQQQVEPGGGWRCAGALGKFFCECFQAKSPEEVLGGNWTQFLEGSFHQVGRHPHPQDYGRLQDNFGKGMGTRFFSRK